MNKLADEICANKLKNIIDDGYDPRGNSTDYYKGECIQCGKKFTFGVGYRDNYNKELQHIEQQMTKDCGMPAAVKARKMADTRQKIAYLQNSLDDLLRHDTVDEIYE